MVELLFHKRDDILSCSRCLYRSLVLLTPGTASACSSSSFSFTTMISYILFIAALFSSQTHSMVLPTNDPIASGQNLTLSGLLNMVNFQCSHEKSWVNIPHFDLGQCFATMYVLMDHENMNPYGPDKHQKFVSPRADAGQGRGNAVLTPRKYVARKYNPSPRRVSLCTPPLSANRFRADFGPGSR